MSNIVRATAPGASAAPGATLAGPLSATAPPSPDASSAEDLVRSGDKYFLIGCLLCGCVVLGPIGFPLIVIGMRKLRKAEILGAAIRPWAITICGGIMLIDASINFLGWGLNLLPAHATGAGQTLWIDWGLFVDGQYTIGYNSSHVLPGPPWPAEHVVLWPSVFFVFPMKIGASWALLKMKRWGLQWSIILNWLYIPLWVGYMVAWSAMGATRLGMSEFGITGYWLTAVVPFLGPIMLLPYLHTLNRARFRP